MSKRIAFFVILFLLGNCSEIDPTKDSYTLSKSSVALGSDTQSTTSERVSNGMSVVTYVKDSKNYMSIAGKEIEITEFSSINSLVYYGSTYYLCPSGNKARLWKYTTSGGLVKIPYYSNLESEIDKTDSTISYELECFMHEKVQEFIILKLIGYKLILTYKIGDSNISEEKQFNENDFLYYVSYDPKLYNSNTDVISSSSGQGSVVVFGICLFQLKIYLKTAKIKCENNINDKTFKCNIVSNEGLLDLSNNYKKGRMSVFYDNNKMYFFSYEPGTKNYEMYKTSEFNYVKVQPSSITKTRIYLPISTTSDIIINNFEFLNDSPNYIFQVTIDGKNYFGEGNAEDDQIVFISDEQIESIKPYKDSQVGFIAVVNSQQTYLVCPYKLSGQECTSTSCQSLGLDPSNKNQCLSSGSGYIKCEEGKMLDSSGQCVECSIIVDGASKSGICKCDTSLYISSGDSCNSCSYIDSSKPYKNVNSQECEASLPSGTYFVDEDLKVYDICDSSCATCSGPESTNCLSCTGDLGIDDGKCVNCKTDGTNDKNYKKYDESECVEEPNNGFFYTNEGFGVFKYCDATCETCEGEGSDQCTKCNTGYFREWNEGNPTPFSCLQTCDEKFYENSSTRECQNCKDTNTFKKLGKENPCTAESDGSQPTGTILVEEDYGIIADCWSTCSKCTAKKEEATENDQKCTECKTGYLLEGNCLTTCGDYYYQDDSSKKCINCKNNSDKPFKLTGNNECIVEPTTPYYVIDADTNTIGECGASCGTCDEGPVTANDDDKCKTCPESKVFSFDKKKCVSKDSCGELYGLDENEENCINCLTINKYKFLTELNCQDKPDNAYIVTDTDKVNYGIIAECDSNCKTCTGESTNCLTCPDGFLLNSAKKCVSSCPDSQGFDDNNDCVNCSAISKVKYANEIRCIDLPSTPVYYVDQPNGIIADCDASCGSCSKGAENGSKNCDTCASDQHVLSFSGGNCGTECEDTMYGIENKKCVKCAAGTFKKDGEGACLTTKPSGYFVDNTEFNHIAQCDSSCAECEDSSTKCTSCPQNKYLNANDNTCGESCPLKYGKENGQCVLCKADGRYIFENGDICYQLANVPTTNYFVKDETEKILGTCSANCATCQNTADECLSCTGSLQYNPTTHTCDSSCPKYYGNENNNCVKCSDNQRYIFENGDTCYEESQIPTDKPYFIKSSTEYILDYCDTTCASCEDSSTKCTSCTGSLYLYSNACQSDCPSFYIKKDNKCLNCKEEGGKYRFENGNICYNLDDVPKDKPFYIKDTTNNILDYCDQSCSSCSGTATTCTDCPTGSYLEFGGTNCVTDCGNYGKNDENHICENCAANSKFLDNDSKKCISEPTQPYAIINEEFKIIELCFNSCQECHGKGDTTDHNCKKCKSNLIFQPNSNNCESSCPNSNYAKENGRCVNCKEQNKFKYAEQEVCVDGKSATEPPRGSLIDQSNKDFNIIKHCHKNCDTCSAVSTDDNDQKCLTCVDGYQLNPQTNNCGSFCLSPKKWIKNSEGNEECIGEVACPSDKPLYVPETSQCVEDCGSTSSCEVCKQKTMYKYKDFCYSSCPSETKEDSNKNLCYTLVNEKSDESECTATLLGYDGNYMTLSSKSLDDSVEELVDDYLTNNYNAKNVRLSLNSNVAIAIFENEDCAKESSLVHNFTYVDAKTCIEILKEKKIIGEDENVIVGTVDIKREEENTNQAGYVLFEKKTRKKLDLTECKQTKVLISYPITTSNIYNMTKGRMIAEKFGADIANPAEPFYNDLCFNYYDENGRDVVLEDRRNDYFVNNTVCEEGCEFNKVDFKTGRVECNCDVKNNLFDEVASNVPFLDFPEGLSITNLVVVRCYNLVFDWNYIKRNKGFWIMAVLIILQIPLMISFSVVGFRSIYSYLNQHSDKLGNYMDEQKEKSKDSSNPSNPPKNKQSQKDVFKTTEENYSEVYVKGKSTPTQSFLTPNSTKHKNRDSVRRDTRLHSTVKIYESSEKAKVSTDSLETKDFTPDELDDLAYEDALELDKRCFCVVFGRLMKKNMIIISVFSNMSPLEPIFVQLSALLLTIGAYFAFNAMFFSDSYISNRYKEDGKIDLPYVLKNELTKSILASLAVMVIKFLIDYVVSGRKRLETLIEKEEDQDQFLRKSREITKSMKKKMVVFIIMDIIFMLLFWYYVSSFCAVYIMTQGAWLEGCLLTFFFCFVFYAFIDFIITLFRFIGLKCHISCFYTFSCYFF